MRGTGQKRLILITLLATSFMLQVFSQCELITDNYSGQIPSSVCAPVTLAMDVRYKFILPVDPSNVQILYVWNDGTGATTTVPAISEGDTIFTATATHIYPPADQCSYTAEAYVIFNGQTCVSSSRQEQSFSAWATDNENGGVLVTEPVVAEYCEGENIYQVFEDNSTFNCNINIEPDKPNRITRWVQFIYGTTSIGGDRIPNITIQDPLGNVYQLTDAAGNSLPPVAGPVIEIPIPADGPSQISWPIIAPAGGVAGDIFEITMRNWNICNPYDKNPFDAVPPTDLVDGDYPPITTTALIEIIETPALVTGPLQEFCAGSNITLSVSSSGGTIDWYSDQLMTDHIHTGSSFDPSGSPTFINNNTAGSHSLWVTETTGRCSSTPARLDFRIYDNPTTPAAGNDIIICSDTYILQGNTPATGTGRWTTTGAAIITDPYNPNSQVTNLAAGPNVFRWTTTNGPCTAFDEVTVTRDLQPSSAAAGIDRAFCAVGSVNLNATPADNGGTGTWTVADGSGSFSNIHNASATLSAPAGGLNSYVWTVNSQFNICPATDDTVVIINDIMPGPANAGPDRGVCDSFSVLMNASTVTGGGYGMWTVSSGTGTFSDPGSPSSSVSNIGYGSNIYTWTVTSMLGLCPGNSDNVTITRDEAPDDAFAGPDQFLCNITSLPLGANAATVGTGSWSVVTNPSGVSPVIAPSVNDPGITLSVLPGNEGLYRMAWTIVNASCITSDTIIVDFGTTVPPAIAGPADTVCGTQAILTGNDPGKAIGTWRKITGPGTVTFMPDEHTRTVIAQVSNGGESLYTFEWKLTSGSCPPSADTVAILFNKLPDMPSSANVQRCGPGTIILQASGAGAGEIYRWYDQPSGGSIISTGSTYTTPFLNNTADYWVTVYNGSTGCESIRRHVSAIINIIPSSPDVPDIKNCGPSVFTLNVVPGAGGTTNNWYDAPSGGNLVAQAASYTTPLLNSSRNYWVSTIHASTGCESPRVLLEIVIDTVPDIPSVTGNERCGEGILYLEAVTGTNGTATRWYNAETGGSLLATAPDYTTPYLSATTTWWVSTVNQFNGCESPRQAVNATIHPIPDMPVVADTAVCGPGQVELSATPGTDGNTLRWYDNITGGTLLATGLTYETEYLTANRSYYVSSYNSASGCESSRRELSVTLLPVPGINPVSGPSIVGVGQINVIYSVNYHPGSTYQWNIPAGMNLILENQNFIIAGFPNMGVYNISVTETNGAGCPGPPSNKQITVSSDTLILNISTLPDKACTGTDMQIFVQPSGGTPSYTFQWSGATANLSSASVADPVFRASSPGNYFLYITVTDINGRKASDTLNVNVYPNPVAQISVPDTVVCAGFDLSLNGIASGGSGNYTSWNWTAEPSVLSSVNSADPVFNTAKPGFYRLLLTVTDDNGCAGNDSVFIFNDSPVSSFSSDAIPGCSPLDVNFINNSVSAATYLWDFGDGQTSTVENPSHRFVNTTTSLLYFDVNLTAISVNNCMHSSNAFVTVYPSPGLEITPYPAVACAPADVILSATPGGFTYDWNFGDGNTLRGSFNAHHTFENITDTDVTYNVNLISRSFFNCTDTASVEILVHPSPEASFAATPLSQMIPDKTVTILNTTPEGNWTYFWSFGDSTFAGVREPGSHVYPGPDDYMLKLVVRSEHCADSAFASIEIKPHPPVAMFKGVSPGCTPLTIQFENMSAYSNEFLWEFGDGAVSNKPNPEYTYYEPGTYKIKLTAWGDGGSDSYSTVNQVYILPNAYFETAPRIVYVNDEEVHFFNLSDNGDIYKWEFGDGTFSDDLNPTHMYEKEGEYDIVLNVWTAEGCYDLYEMKEAVIVKPSGIIYFPNVFRPESEIEENRVFRPGIIDHVEEYHLMIFNRWGELIFENYDWQAGWDGYVNGVMSKQDVYIWKVEGKYSSGQTFTESGDVTLMH